MKEKSEDSCVIRAGRVSSGGRCSPGKDRKTRSGQGRRWGSGLCRPEMDTRTMGPPSHQTCSVSAEDAQCHLAPVCPQLASSHRTHYTEVAEREKLQVPVSDCSLQSHDLGKSHNQSVTSRVLISHPSRGIHQGKQGTHGVANGAGWRWALCLHLHFH